jgi:bacillolysin
LFFFTFLLLPLFYQALSKLVRTLLYDSSNSVAVRMLALSFPGGVNMKYRALVLAGLFASSGAYAGGPFFSSNQLNLNRMLLETAYKIQAQGEGLRQLSQLQASLSNPSLETKPIQEVLSDEIRTAKFQSYYEGIEVLGSMIMVHTLKNGDSRVTHNMERFDLDTRPSVSRSEAVSIARAWAGDRKLQRRPELRIFPGQEEGSARLIYEVEFSAKETNPSVEYFVDAHSGEMIAEIPSHMSIAPIDIYVAGDKQDLDPSGFPMSMDIRSYDHVISDTFITEGATPAALRAHENAEKTLRYFSDVHQRNSFDNRGSSLVSVVNVGKDFANAFWREDLQIMGYGSGDGERMRCLTHGLDVAGHEMTHGVIASAVQSGSRRGLMYIGDAGSLNEAFADFFGKMVEDTEDWVVGRDIFIDPAMAENGIRNIAHPERNFAQYRTLQGERKIVPYPSHMDDRLVSQGICQGNNNHCWVHVNSTIFSHAAYQMYNSIGKEKTEKLLYRVLAHYLKPLSGFRQAAQYTREACSDLQYHSHTCKQVSDALAAVGL